MKALFVVLAITLAACSPGPAPEPPAPETPEPAVFDPLTDAVDRAAGVEDTLRESAADRRRQLDEAEGLR